MKFIPCARLCLLAVLCSFSFSLRAQESAQGAGSSAAAPLYRKWAQAFMQIDGTKISYDAVGSSAGLKKVREKTVDFGASDVALPAADLHKYGLIQFPSAISGVVPVINLPGVRAGDLRLTGELLAEIFSGKIKSWQDARIAATNPTLRLPDKAIQVIVRQDGSGTTYNFSDYLSKVSPVWKTTLGRNFTLSWPEEFKQVKGSALIVEQLKKTAYAISYVDYNYVLQDHLDFAQLLNLSGKFVSPSAEGFQSALKQSAWKSKGAFEETLTQKPGNMTWPITMGTFVLIPRISDAPGKTIAALRFFSWAFMHGDRLVDDVDMVRLPDAIQARAYREMTTVSDRNGAPLNWGLPH